MENEIDFDDVSFEPTASVDDKIETTPEVVDSIIEPTKKEEKKDEGTPSDTKPKKEVKPDETPKDEPEDTEIQENFIISMAKKQGIEIPEGLEFEDSEEGLVEFNEYVADVRSDQKLNEYLDALPPRIGQAFDLAQLISDLPLEEQEEKISAFFKGQSPEIDYKAVDLNKEEMQKTIMRTFYKKMDYSDEEIKEAIEDLELSDTLKKQASVAASKLGALQEKEKNVILEKEREATLARKQHTQKFFGSVKQIIESGKVNNFTIPNSEKRAAFDYDTSGQFAKDLNEALQDPIRRTELNIAFRNKFNLSKFIETAATTQRTNSLRDKVANSKLKGSGNANSVSNSAIDWDAL